MRSTAHWWKQIVSRHTLPNFTFCEMAEVVFRLLPRRGSSTSRVLGIMFRVGSGRSVPIDQDTHQYIHAVWHVASAGATTLCLLSRSHYLPFALTNCTIKLPNRNSVEPYGAKLVYSNFILRYMLPPQWGTTKSAP